MVKKRRLFWLLCMVFAMLLVLVGCAKPPEAEKQTAKVAMEVAVSAGAEKYAVADLDAAKKIWDTAEFQMKEKKYKEAKQSYIDAKVAFEKANGAVAAGKKGSLKGTWVVPGTKLPPPGEPSTFKFLENDQVEATFFVVLAERFELARDGMYEGAEKKRWGFVDALQRQRTLSGRCFQRRTSHRVPGGKCITPSRLYKCRESITAG